jgi:hypothetical protein
MMEAYQKKQRRQRIRNLIKFSIFVTIVVFFLIIFKILITKDPESDKNFNQTKDVPYLSSSNSSKG